MDSVLAEVVGAFHQQAVFDHTLPPDDPLRKEGDPIGRAFTEGVRSLKSAFPNEAIRTLMTFAWDIVGHKITPVVLGPNVGTLSIGVVGNDPKLLRAMIFAPHNWTEKIKQDPLYELGALVFVGSQAVDFYNGRFAVDQSPTVRARAWAFEAEYLLTLQRMNPTTWTPNEYQKGVLEDFPQGLRTPTAQALLYDYKPFTPPS